MVSKQTRRSVEWNREGRNKPTFIQSVIYGKGGNVTQTASAINDAGKTQ